MVLSAMLVFLSGAGQSHAQGTINFGNGITATRFPIYGPDYSLDFMGVVGNSSLSSPTGSTVYGGALLSGTRYKIEFWAGPASATDFSGLTLLTTMTFRTGSNPNLLPNGITVTMTLPVPGVLPDRQAKLAVRVWDTTGATAYETAFPRGQGNLFLSAPLGGVTPSITLLPPNWVGESFSLISPPFPSPEPSAFALTGISAASLLHRRRK